MFIMLTREKICKFRKKGLQAAVCTISIFYALSGVAHAATMTVNSTADTNSRDTVLTLREAIMLSEGTLSSGVLTAGELAQVSGTPGSGIADTITFTTALGTITLGSALPSLADAAGVIIDGTGKGVTTSGPSAVANIFTINGNNNTIRGLTVNGGSGATAIVINSGATSGTVIENNTITTVSAMGLDSVGGDNSTIRNNTFQTSGKWTAVRFAGISPASDNNLFSGNTVTVTSVGDYGVFINGASDNNKIYLNLIRGVTGGLGHGIGVDGTGTQIFHNTINGNTGNGIHVVSIGPTGMDFRNNILSNNGGAGISSGAAQATINYNDFFNNTGGTCIGGCAIGANSITADPLYTNPAANDFTLQSGSPAINAGLDLDTVSAGLQPDVNGSTAGKYNGSAPDMGAFESTPSTSTFTQSAYRLFNNANATDVGTALAAQDTAATLGSSGASFRIRTLVHVATASLGISGQSFKLQFVGKGTGTCAAPSGGTPAAYTDVTAATAIAYLDNVTPADGAALTANVADPTHGADTIVNQSYEELNNNTNAQGAIASGQDGKWDFAFKDNGALASAGFCFRVVKSDGTALDSYTVYPEIVTAPLLLVKQVWLVGGSSPLATSPGTPTGTTVPAGTTVVFLIYVKNSATTAPADIRIQDLLDITATGFNYVASSIIRTSAATPPADTASDLDIFNATATGVGTAMTDAVDGDIASICDSGAAACPGTNLNRVTVGNTAGLTPNQVNATLSIPANSTFAIRFLAVKQ